MASTPIALGAAAAAPCPTVTRVAVSVVGSVRLRAVYLPSKGLDFLFLLGDGGIAFGELLLQLGNLLVLLIQPFSELGNLVT